MKVGQEKKLPLDKKQPLDEHISFNCIPRESYNFNTSAHTYNHCTAILAHY